MHLKGDPVNGKRRPVEGAPTRDGCPETTDPNAARATEVRSERDSREATGGYAVAKSRQHAPVGPPHEARPRTCPNTYNADPRRTIGKH